MQVNRSRGVTTLRLTKRERDTLKAAYDLADYIHDLPQIDSAVQKSADNAATGLEALLGAVMAAMAEKETVQA